MEAQRPATNPSVGDDRVPIVDQAPAKMEAIATSSTKPPSTIHSVASPMLCVLSALDCETPVLGWTSQPATYAELCNSLHTWIAAQITVDKACIFVWHAMIKGKPYCIDELNYKNLPRTVIIQCFQLKVPDDAKEKTKVQLFVVPVKESSDMPRYPSTATSPDADDFGTLVAETIVDTDVATLFGDFKDVFPEASPILRDFDSDVGYWRRKSRVSPILEETLDADSPPQSYFKRQRKSSSINVEGSGIRGHCNSPERGTKLIVPDVSSAPGDTRRRSSAMTALTTLTRSPDPKSRNQSIAESAVVFRDPFVEQEGHRQYRPKPQSVTDESMKPPPERDDVETETVIPTTSRAESVVTVKGVRRSTATRFDLPLPEDDDDGGHLAGDESDLKRQRLNSPASDQASCNSDDVQVSLASEFLALDAEVQRIRPHTRNLNDEQFNNSREKSRQVNAYVAPLGPLKVAQIDEEVPYTFYAEDSGDDSSDTDLEDTYLRHQNYAAELDTSQSSGGVDPTLLAFLAPEEPYDVEKFMWDPDDQTYRQRIAAQQVVDVAVSDISDGLPERTPSPPQSLRLETVQVSSESAASQPSLLPPPAVETLLIPGLEPKDRWSSEALPNSKKNFKCRYGLKVGSKFQLLEQPIREVVRKKKGQRYCHFVCRGEKYWNVVPSSYEEASRTVSSMWNFPAESRFVFILKTTPYPETPTLVFSVVMAENDWSIVTHDCKIEVSTLNNDVPSPNIWHQTILKSFQQFWQISNVQNDVHIRRFARRQSRQRKRLKYLFPDSVREEVREPKPIPYFVPEALRKAREEEEGRLKLKGIEKVVEPPIAGPSQTKRGRSSGGFEPPLKRFRHVIDSEDQQLVVHSYQFPPPPLPKTTSNSDTECPVGTLMDATSMIRRRRLKGKRIATTNESVVASGGPVFKTSAAIAPKALPNPNTGLYVPTPLDWEKQARQLVKNQCSSALIPLRRRPSQVVEVGEDDSEEEVSSLICEDGDNVKRTKIKRYKGYEDFGPFSYTRALNLQIPKENETSPPEHDEMGRVLPLLVDGTNAHYSTTRAAESELLKIPGPVEGQALIQLDALALLRINFQQAQRQSGKNLKDTWISKIPTLPSNGLIQVCFVIEDFLLPTCSIASHHDDNVTSIYVKPEMMTRQILDYAITCQFKNRCFECWQRKFGVESSRKCKHDVQWVVQLCIDERPILSNVELGNLGLGRLAVFSLISRPIDSITELVEDEDEGMSIRSGWKSRISEDVWTLVDQENNSKLDTLNNTEGFSDVPPKRKPWGEDNDYFCSSSTSEDDESVTNQAVVKKAKSKNVSCCVGKKLVVHPSQVVPKHATYASGATLNYFVGGIPWCYEKEPGFF